MRKITAAAVLVLSACGAVFAQEGVSQPSQPAAKLFNVTVEAAIDPLFIRSFFDDYAEREPSVTTGDPPFLYQGEGTIKSFQSSGFIDGMKGRVKFSYEDEILGGLLELRSMDESSYGTINGNRYVLLGYWDWNIWAKLFKEHMRILAGNTAQRGQVDAYSNFDGFLKGNIGSLGVFYPIWRRTPRATELVNNLNIRATFPYTAGQENYNMGFADFTSTDALDMFYPADLAGRQQLGFLIDAAFDPVTVTASAGGLFSSESLPFKTPWMNSGDGTRLTDYDRAYDPVGITGMNFGVRVEGAKIADMLTIAAVYKYAESALNKLTAKKEDWRSTPVDESNGSHSFGLFATITPADGLGITAGWSALAQRWENPLYEEYVLNGTDGGPDNKIHWLSGYKEVRFPFYNGVDLRFNYTGIEKLNITFNNNVSFAEAQGADNTESNKTLWVVGWAYADQAGLNPPATINAESRKENYLGVYNALSVHYAMSDTLSITGQAANRLGIFTLTWEDDPRTSITDSLSLYAGVTYRIFRRHAVQAVIRTGFACVINNYLYQFTDPKASIQKAGYADYGIPLSLALTF